MKFFGKTLKSILRFIFSIIIFVLFVGLAKMDRNVASYMSFLSNNSRSDLHRSQPANRTNSFWPHIQTTGNIADIISNENVLPANAGDPTFEEEFNPITDTSLSNGSGESFGFTTDEQLSGTTSGSANEITSGTRAYMQKLTQ